MNSEIEVINLADLRARPKPTRWGKWRLVRKGVIRFGTHGYEVNCNEMTTSAACLDWIFQVSRKRWMTDSDRGDLLRAIQDLVDSQATLCSFGIEKGRRIAQSKETVA